MMYMAIIDKKWAFFMIFTNLIMLDLVIIVVVMNFDAVCNVIEEITQIK